MAKITVCGLGFRGHVNPLLPLVGALVGRGHAVEYFCTAEYSDEIAAAGATPRAYASMFEPNFAFPAADAAFSLHLVTVMEARKVLPQVLSAVRGAEPDLVIYDGACLAGRLLGQLLGCPTAKLCPSYASTEDYSPFEAGRKRFFESSEKVAAFDAEVAKLNAEFPVGYDLRGPAGHAEGLNIVCMPREFHPNPGAFDGRFAFVGPSLPAGPPAPLDRAGSARPLLYISLGTLNNDKPGFYQECFETFGGGRFDVWMPVGSRVDPAGWRVPENFRVAPFFDQLSVLARAACFVTQGGMNSVQEALAAAVPLVVLPSTGEQALTAGRVAGLGLGVDLGAERPPAPELAAEVDAVTRDEATRDALAAFAARSRAAGGPSAAADRVEGYLG